MSVGTGRQNIIILIWKQHFHFWEYINGNQTFILDSHRPFICSVPGCHIGSELLGSVAKPLICGIYIYIPFYLLLISWNSVYKVTTHALVKTETWNLGTWVNDHTDRQQQGQSGKSTTFSH
jgi:hypothetical protein